MPATLHCLVQVEQMRGSAERAGLSADDRAVAAEEALSQAQQSLNEARHEHAELVQQRDAAAAAAAGASAQVCCRVMWHQCYVSKLMFLPVPCTLNC